MNEMSWFKRILLLALSVAIFVITAFWMDFREQFEDFIAPAKLDVHTVEGHTDLIDVPSPGTYYFAGGIAASATAFDIGDLRTSDAAGGRTVVSFRLRADAPGRPYPVLVLAPLDNAGKPTRTLLFSPTAYGHKEASGSEIIQIAFAPGAGEWSAMVRPIELTLHPLP